MEELKADATKNKAGLLQVMDETGVFSVVYQHGFLQFIMDMVQSGKLWVIKLADVNLWHILA